MHQAVAPMPSPAVIFFQQKNGWWSWWSWSKTKGRHKQVQSKPLSSFLAVTCWWEKRGTASWNQKGWRQGMTMANFDDQSLVKIGPVCITDGPGKWYSRAKACCHCSGQNTTCKWTKNMKKTIRIGLSQGFLKRTVSNQKRFGRPNERCSRHWKPTSWWQWRRCNWACPKTDGSSETLMAWTISFQSRMFAKKSQISWILGQGWKCSRSHCNLDCRMSIKVAMDCCQLPRLHASILSSRWSNGWITWKKLSKTINMIWYMMYASCTHHISYIHVYVEPRKLHQTHLTIPNMMIFILLLQRKNRLSIRHTAVCQGLKHQQLASHKNWPALLNGFANEALLGPKWAWSLDEHENHELFEVSNWLLLFLLKLSVFWVQTLLPDVGRHLILAHRIQQL